MVTTTAKMESWAEPHGPGKTAPRFIEDLYDHDPRFRLGNDRNILADPALQFFNAKLPTKHPNACRHTSLMRKDTPQTNTPLSDTERPTSSTKYVIPTFCQVCKYHFQIAVDFTCFGNAQTPCSLSNESNPLHHLRRVDTPESRQLREYGPTKGDKYNSWIEDHTFVCSASRCPMVVNVKIMPPRLKQKWMNLLTNPALVYERGKREIQNDPARFGENERPQEVIQVLGYLRQYLKDAKDSRDSPNRKRLSKRNKKYITSFSSECERLFEYLDFTTLEEPSDDGEDEINYFWQLPVVTPKNSNFIDDVIVELANAIFERPTNEHKIVPTAVAFVPVNASHDIQRSLGCLNYPTRSRTVDLSIQEHPYYASLGARDNFTDDLLSWSYDRQCECDPPNKAYYFDCLEDLAKGRDSEKLQTKVAMALSAGEQGLKQIQRSYKFFGLDMRTTEGDDHIMGVYKSRIESAPRQKEEAKECLISIGRHRDSAKIEALAHDTAMTPEEAFKLLGVTADTASDSIDAAAVAAVLDYDQARVAHALEVLAKHRDNDMVLHRAAERLKSGSGGPTLTISDAYARLQLTEQHVPDETVFNYYLSLIDQAGSASGSRESYIEALRVIAIDRGSNFLLRKLEDPSADVVASTAEPVGLENIGNTCYLNSLLQYYYTVKPVRDMVIDFQNHRMSLDENEIKKKRVGGRIVTKSEIIKAQKFVDELHNLFENLKTASSRSIRPTRELAELTIFSSAAAANFRRQSISSPSGPPDLDMILDRPVYGPQWPPPSTAPLASAAPQPSPIEDDIEMVDNPIDKDMDIPDDSSDSTLVNDETAKNLTSTTNGKITEPQTRNSQDKDVIMIDGGQENGIKKSQPSPEKPPPIPPRNKSNLVISTTDSNNRTNISDDELWRFGSQQDVTEVIGNVMFRLQCAIKPTSIEDGSGVQIDVIRDSFYGANTVYNQKGKVLEKKVEVWPNIIVFPGKSVAGDIYEALDVVYDEITVEIDKQAIPQYTSISTLPPILQIQIQRTDYDTQLQRSSKNRTPVIFPETIYLDRYVDSDQNSLVMRRRRETWKWKKELRALETRKSTLLNEEAEINVADALHATKDYISTLQESEIPDLDIPDSLPDALEARLSEVAEELETISRQINEIKRNLAEQFTDMRQYEYKLHSVFIHRGETGGGHYWIYIFDFEAGIWREYNDEYVTEVKDRRKIFDQVGAGGMSGTPYYLVYVRSADRAQLVDAVCRDVKEVTTMDGIADHHLLDLDDAGGGDWQDDEDVKMGEVRHIEHVRPRAIRPKSLGSSATGIALKDMGSGDDGGWDKAGATGWGDDYRSSLDANGKPWN